MAKETRITMSTKVASSEVQLFLKGIEDVTEIVDGQGNVLGTFSPSGSGAGDLAARAAKVFNEEEGKSRFRTEHGKGKPLQEVVQRLTDAAGKLA
jgi:hypothetical protein